MPTHTFRSESIYACVCVFVCGCDCHTDLDQEKIEKSKQGKIKVQENIERMNVKQSNNERIL